MYSTGVVGDNTYVAASRTGLEKNEIAALQRSLPPRYDLRHLKNGESPKPLLQERTGQPRVMVHKFTSGKFNYTAYRISDKEFYNLSGTDSRAKLDYPLPVTARSNPPFSPARLSPMSEKVGPRNGIDYSMPVNTKIVGVINGRVTRIGYNSAMGYFVEVSGKDNARTRYLHPGKIFVKEEIPALRGTAIALSGNSGRSSSPHLHYELVINSSPVSSLAFRAAGPADNNKLEQHAYAHAHDYERYLD